jgi:hypothetical protein
MKKESVFITARVRIIHKSQLEELANAEGRTRSSMIRCLIERAYREHIARKGEHHAEMISVSY